MATYSGPLPPSGMYCTLCAAQYKSSGIEAAKAAGQNPSEAGTHVDLRKVQREVLPPAIAVTYALINLPVLQDGARIGDAPVLAPVCWTHDLPLNLLDTSLSIGTAGVPGLPGGAADLSQSAARGR